MRYMVVERFKVTAAIAAVMAFTTFGAGSWSKTAPVPEPIEEEHGTLFEGHIYIAGGFDSTDSPTKVAYRYDPARDHWDRIADLPEPRHHMPLAVVNDTLYAVGGLRGAQQFVGTTNLWIYRPGRNVWESRSELPTPRGASAVGVVGGKLIVVGGFGAHRDLLDSIAIYDPATNRWTNHTPIPTKRDHLTAQVVNGVLYAIGGRPISLQNFDVVEAYDAATDRWTTKSPMPSHRGGLGSAVLDGQIHTFGGEQRGGVFANHEIYDPARDTWTIAAPMPTARHGLAAVAANGRIYVIGGGTVAGAGETGVVEVWSGQVWIFGRRQPLPRLPGGSNPRRRNRFIQRCSLGSTTLINTLPMNATPVIRTSGASGTGTATAERVTLKLPRSGWPVHSTRRLWGTMIFNSPMIARASISDVPGAIRTCVRSIVASPMTVSARRERGITHSPSRVTLDRNVVMPSCGGTVSGATSTGVTTTGGVGAAGGIGEVNGSRVRGSGGWGQLLHAIAGPSPVRGAEPIEPTCACDPALSNL